ncbi:unnamed protein product [Notodromas monacha]|uniref:Uncharacterized protein n=1 Tax=Notodromas monacha TaxID=399045 RepID=A0A7R9G801_9CRUS|nr:unnamed protein product [Notodromas monacha]CAG0912755.1 unnamed protein product [Notodromas monacha]
MCAAKCLLLCMKESYLFSCPLMHSNVLLTDGTYPHCLGALLQVCLYTGFLLFQIRKKVWVEYGICSLL